MAEMGSYKVTGLSMAPNILPGDWLLGEPGTAFRHGDVVVIDRGERWVAHRVILIGRNCSWEMGDATPLAARFTRDQVIARVVTVVRPGGQQDLTTRSARIYGRLWAARLLMRHFEGRLRSRFRERARRR